MAHWIAPSRRAVIAVGMVIAFASVGAVAAGEFLIAPLQPGGGDTAIAPGHAADPVVDTPKEGRCNYGMGGWFG